MITQEQLDRLPKYARDHIEALERKVSKHEQRDLEVENHTTGIEWSENWKDRHALPKGSTVWFGTSPNRVTVHVRHDGEIRVSAQDNLVIYPGASNTVTVKSVR